MKKSRGYIYWGDQRFPIQKTISSTYDEYRDFAVLCQMWRSHNSPSKV